MRSDNSHRVVKGQTSSRRHPRTRPKSPTRTWRNRPAHTITQIAAHAGVSRSWLYSQPELRDQLHRLITTLDTDSSAPQPTEHASKASLRQRLTLAHECIRELDHQNRQLPNQIAHPHGQLRANRITNAPVTDTVHDANTLVTLPTAHPARDTLASLRSRTFRSSSRTRCCSAVVAPGRRGIHLSLQHPAAQRLRADLNLRADRLQAANTDRYSSR